MIRMGDVGQADVAMGKLSLAANSMSNHYRPYASSMELGCLDRTLGRMGSLSADNSPENKSPMHSSNDSWSMAMDFLYSGSSPNPCQQSSNNKKSTSNHVYLKRSKPYLEEEDWEMGNPRSRVSTMPSRSPRASRHNSPSGSVDDFPVRSFTITPKGVVNLNSSSSRPGSFKKDVKKSYQHTSLPQPLTSASKPKIVYRVLLVGSSGVGKNVLVKQFIDVRNNQNDTGSFDEDDIDKCVSVLLDGEESIIEFIEISDSEVDDEVIESNLDGYVVVYSVEDRRSFEAAINRLYEIREGEGRHVALILVANKTDLVRSRIVQEEEGRAAAKTYDSKYIEVSATIDLHINELLVGVLKQIRLCKEKYDKSNSRWGNSSCFKEASSFLEGCCFLQARQFFKRVRIRSKSCDNLYVL